MPTLAEYKEAKEFLSRSDTMFSLLEVFSLALDEYEKHDATIRTLVREIKYARSRLQNKEEYYRMIVKEMKGTDE